MSKTKIKINSIWGSLLFEYEGDSLKDAVVEAVKNGANLTRANLDGANLYGANLDGANGLYPIVPEEGSFIGFKKTQEDTIIKLLIPEDAERVGGFIGRKCRASKAIVLSGSGHSKHNEDFVYKEGETIIPDSWDSDPRLECSHGIHFFLTKKEAEIY